MDGVDFDSSNQRKVLRFHLTPFQLTHIYRSRNLSKQTENPRLADLNLPRSNAISNVSNQNFSEMDFFFEKFPWKPTWKREKQWEIQMQTISTNGDGVEGVHRALGLLWPCSRRSALVNSDSLVCLSGIVPMNVTWRTYITSAISIKVKWKMQHPLDSSHVVLRRLGGRTPDTIDQTLWVLQSGPN